MMTEPVLYDLAGEVARITLNRPERRNALNSAMRRALLAALRRARGEARVIVLAGAGGAFCAGQDLAEADLNRPGDLVRFLREEYEPILLAIHEADQVVIAAVEGAAAGAGASMALGCDIVIAAESAVFIQGFGRIGLIPDAGGTWWLPRLAGVPRAMGATLLGESIAAGQAADWGMIWESVPDPDFSARVGEAARRLAQGPFEAQALTKRALRASSGAGLKAQLALEAELQGRALAGAEFREGVTAFREKRRPDFRGGTR